MTEISAHALEARLRIIEDKLAIYQLIASHPPSADTAHSDYTASVYLKEGVFDRGPDLEGAQGVAGIAAFTLKPAHEEAIQGGGLAHFAGLPLIFLNGDSAVVTSYLLIIQLDKEGQHRTLANHGTSSGYRIHRAVVNRWELERHQAQWKIKRRTLLPVDGGTRARKLLLDGLNEVLQPHA